MKNALGKGGQISTKKAKMFSIISAIEEKKFQAHLYSSTQECCGGSFIDEPYSHLIPLSGVAVQAPPSPPQST
jgi:hypothetical protein